MASMLRIFYLLAVLFVLGEQALTDSVTSAVSGVGQAIAGAGHSVIGAVPNALGAVGVAGGVLIGALDSDVGAGGR